jgi:hypothetical protein
MGTGCYLCSRKEALKEGRGSSRQLHQVLVEIGLPSAPGEV